MFPVTLFTIGPLAISTFGVFLALSLIYGLFLVFRLARAWDLDVEKIIDFALIIFLVGLFSSRLFFISLSWDFFGADLGKMINFIKYPGFSFWGAFLGGWLSLFYLSRRHRFDFYQIADLAAIGFLGGVVLGDLGCFLGSGCGLGIKSDLFFATPVIGAVGKRFPVYALEAVIFAFILFKLWKAATRFHFRGKIVSLTLIYAGLAKFILEFLKQSQNSLMGSGFFLSAAMLVLGITTFYKTSKRSLIDDLKSVGRVSVSMLTEPKAWLGILERIQTSWYNNKTTWSWKLRSFKKILRRARVKPTPENFQSN